MREPTISNSKKTTAFTVRELFGGKKGKVVIPRSVATNTNGATHCGRRSRRKKPATPPTIIGTTIQVTTCACFFIVPTPLLSL
jgi:hypothetical protein